ncbi:MAG: type II toxin-antitoxin system Y4mF family antitoxin [Desulfobaccales bacterium]
MTKEFSTFLKSARKKSGLSQAELARLAGIGKTAVFDLEHGKATVQLDTLLKVLRVLNIRIEFAGPLGERMKIGGSES